MSVAELRYFFRVTHSYSSQGPWVVQRAVGTKPLIVGRALKVTYHSSPKFMEIDIDIGSSTVANNIVRFVLGYVRTLVVDMCFLIEGKDDDELPVRQLRFESKLLLIHDTYFSIRSV